MSLAVSCNTAVDRHPNQSNHVVARAKDKKSIVCGNSIRKDEQKYII